MTNVLLTGAGTAAGTAIARALVDGGQVVVAVDRDEQADGSAIADDHAVVDMLDEPARALAALNRVIDHRAIDLVLAATSDDMAALLESAADLHAPIWLPSRRSLHACRDRARFWKIAEHARLPVVPHARANDGIRAVPGPWIVTSRVGSDTGGRVAHDLVQLADACHGVPDAVIRSDVRGRAFVVDLLADGAGRLAGAVPQWADAAPGNDGTAVFRDDRLRALVRRFVAAYDITGAAGLHGVATDDGVVVVALHHGFTERVASALAAGSDLVGELLRGSLGLTVRRERLRVRNGRAAAAVTERTAA